MSIPLEILRARIEKQAVVKVTLNYYPGAHWDCELHTIDGRTVCAEPDRHWGRLIIEALRQLEESTR